VVISPDTITGGQTTQGAVNLTATAGPGGVLVMLQSSSPIAALVPAFVIVQQGQTNAVFTVSTNKVTIPQTVAITASAGGVSRTAVITVE